MSDAKAVPLPTGHTWRVVSAFCDVMNQVKRAAFRPDLLDLDHYLGGDLGIDSIEMLEIWYDLEKRLGVCVPDDEKRGVVTLRQVVAVFQQKLQAA